MWRVYRMADKDLLDLDGEVIFAKGEWYSIGTYWTIDEAASIVKHEIYLDNCVATEESPIPQFKIVSCLE